MTVDIAIKMLPSILATVLVMMSGYSFYEAFTDLEGLSPPGDDDRPYERNRIIARCFQHSTLGVYYLGAAIVLAIIGR